MAEGNGIELGSIYGLLLDVAKTVSGHDATFERQDALLERQGAMLDRNMATRAGLTDLRQTVSGYHSAVGGQGLPASELEGRVQRIEGHRDLPPFVHG